MAVEWGKLLSLDKLIEVLIKTRALQLGGLVVCGLLIASVKIGPVHDFFGLQEVAKQMPLLFVIGIVCIGLGAGGMFAEWNQRTAEGRRFRNALNERLQNLTEDEKDALRPYVEKNKRTSHFNMTKGTPGSLEAKGILYRSSAISSSYMTFPYSIQDVAFDILKDHPEYLEASNQA